MPASPEVNSLEIIIDVILTKRHGEKLELDFYDQRKSLYYLLMMAQVLGWSLVTVHGIEFELEGGIT